MASRDDVDLLLNNRQVIQSRQPDAPPLDFSGADLAAVDFRDLQLNGANFTGAKLMGARFARARLNGAKMSRADLRGADFTRAILDRADLSECDLSPLDATPCSLEGAHLHDANLSRANLQQAVFKSTPGRETNFDGCDIRGGMFDSASIPRSTFRGANLAGVSMRRCQLEGCDFSTADIAGLDFFESEMNGTQFGNTRNARLAINLTTVKQHPYNFDECDRHFLERWFDWERIRTFGRLPLFGASYTALAFIVIYLGAIEFYNDKVDLMHRWADRAATASEEKLPHRAADPLVHLADTVKEKLSTQRPPDQAWLILGSTLFLAVASTIYVIKCPEEIKEFSRAQWCYELKHELIHYWARSWRNRLLRVICGSLYLVGAALAGWVILCKIWWVISYLSRSAFG